MGELAHALCKVANFVQSSVLQVRAHPATSVLFLLDAQNKEPTNCANRTDEDFLQPTTSISTLKRA